MDLFLLQLEDDLYGEVVGGSAGLVGLEGYFLGEIAILVLLIVAVVYFVIKNKAKKKQDNRA